MKKANVITAFLWLLALALAAWALKEIDFQTAWEQLLRLSAWQYGLWLALNILVAVVSTLRWQLLIAALSSSVSLGSLLSIRLAGQTISFITPGPQFGGEPLQVYWLYKRCALPLHKAISSLGLDRCFELWVNFSVLLIGAAFLLLSPSMAFAQWGQITLLLFAITLAMPIAFFYVLNAPQKLISRIRQIANRWLTHPKLIADTEAWQQLEWDLTSLFSQHRGTLVKALVVSVLVWGLILGELYFLLSLLEISASAEQFVLIAVAIRLAMLLPLPGGIGTIEAALLWCFQMLDLSMSDAFALIALMRLRDIAILLAGFISLRIVKSATP